MAKDYSVELGGQPRFFKYTLAERKELEKRFGQELKGFILEKVLPIDATTNRPTGGGIFEAQIAFLYAGIKHKLAKKHDRETQIEEWVEQFIHAPAEVGEDGKTKRNSMLLLLMPAFFSLLQSGVLGQEILIEDFSDDEEGSDSEAGPKVPEP